MGETKVFSFPDAGGFGGSNGLAAMLPALLQNRGIDTAALLGMMNNGNGGFFGNNGGFQDIIALIVIAAIFGNGNFGFGGNSNGRGDTERQMLNSIFHESHHLSSMIAKVLGWDLMGEEVCYLSGEIGQQMYPIVSHYLCENCRGH